MELHEENAFKIRGYQNAIFVLEKTDKELSTLDEKGLNDLEGVGKSIAGFIAELLSSGKAAALEDLLSKTPEGVVEMLEIKGLGPKKIKVLWKEVGVTTISDLKEACERGEIAKVKGFGQKTQDSILQALEYTEANKGKYHYADVHEVSEALLSKCKSISTNLQLDLTGDMRRKMEVIEKIEILCGGDWEEFSALGAALEKESNIEKNETLSSPSIWRARLLQPDLAIELIYAAKDHFAKKLLETSSSRAHLAYEIKDDKTILELANDAEQKPRTEEEIYKLADMPLIPAELREGFFEWEMAKADNLPTLLEDKDLKGILHNHSTYSDGKHSLKEMAAYCKSLGYEYLGISDHSKTAFYANGLDEAKVKKQQEEIDQLNQELAPFRIFKGIESDILNDGSLDYAPDVLASFDFIVSSIHSPLNMDIKKATDRLLKAIHNPFTTILGHPTGRLLLKREGYPIDHKAVIDACAEKGVIIEINANPWRLDLDWRWVHYAISQGVMLSINPDAHEMSGYHHMQYGVLVGRKGGLTADMTFNALGREAVATHFQKRKEAAKANI